MELTNDAEALAEGRGEEAGAGGGADEGEGLEAGAILPYDEAIKEHDLEQRPLLELPDSSPAARAVAGLMERIIHQNPSKIKGAVK